MNPQQPTTGGDDYPVIIKDPILEQPATAPDDDNSKEVRSAEAHAPVQVGNEFRDPDFYGPK